MKPIKQDIISEIERKGNEKIYISIKYYKESDWIDLRQVIVNPGADPIYTQKGITLPVENLPELKEAILALEGALGKGQEKQD